MIGVPTLLAILQILVIIISGVWVLAKINIRIEALEQKLKAVNQHVENRIMKSTGALNDKIDARIDSIEKTQTELLVFKDSIKETLSRRRL